MMEKKRKEMIKEMILFRGRFTWTAEGCEEFLDEVRELDRRESETRP